MHLYVKILDMGLKLLICIGNSQSENDAQKLSLVP